MKLEMKCDDMINNSQFRVTSSGKTIFIKYVGLMYQYRIDWNCLPKDIQHAIQFPTLTAKGIPNDKLVKEYFSKVKGKEIRTN